jgi:hypothetical protein
MSTKVFKNIQPPSLAQEPPSGSDGTCLINMLHCQAETMRGKSEQSINNVL